MHKLSLYIHIPWCIKKCPYCDFNSHEVKVAIPQEQYIKSVLADLQEDLLLLGDKAIVGSIFIGGGTPSLFAPAALGDLLSGVAGQVTLTSDVEITLEANPGTFEAKKFVAYQQIGINRLSIGVQSFNDQHLQKLGRVHTGAESIYAGKIAQDAGFANINIDLMFGLPKQSSEQMLADMQTAIDIGARHISFYQLTIEPNTYFYKFPPKLPASDTIFAGQKLCQKLLMQQGYQQYEISAYAQDGNSCRHNTNYWQFGDYLGIGAGAHGKISNAGKIQRTTKSKNPAQYLHNRGIIVKDIAKNELPVEYLINQLRLKAGFNLRHYQQATGLDAATITPTLANCVELGLLCQENGQFYCSAKGWDFVDDIIEKFL